MIPVPPQAMMYWQQINSTDRPALPQEPLTQPNWVHPGSPAQRRKFHPFSPQITNSTNLKRARPENQVSHGQELKHQKQLAPAFDTVPWDIFSQFLKWLNHPRFVLACACVNTHWNKVIESSCNLMTSTDLKRICPNLTVLDAEAIRAAYNLEILDEPFVNNYKVIQSIQQLSDEVLNNAGFSLVTMPPDRIVHEFLRNHVSNKFSVFQLSLPNNFEEEKTTRILMTNANIKGTHATPTVRKKMILNSHNCEMPTAYNYFFLCSLYLS